MFGMRGVGANVNEEKLVRDDESMSQSSDTKRDPYATIEKDKVVEEQESILRENKRGNSLSDRPHQIYLLPMSKFLYIYLV